MYLKFFDLTKEPFNITPDPGLLFLSPSHREALAAAVYGVKQRKGFIAIVGEVGVGKTTILRSFLERVDDRLKVIYLFNANLSFEALLRTIYQGLGRTPETAELYEMVDRLHRILIEEYQAGHNVVLVVDEAQNMPTATLENLRMLSNLETATDKLIQVVFSGQPEFEQRLAQPNLRQFGQRIVISVRIRPLTEEESLAYIEHRIAKTAGGERELFSAGALRRVVRAAGGIPRLINILCDNCLITAFGRQEKRVSTRVAREIVAERDGIARATLDWRVVLPAVLLAVAMILLIFQSTWGPYFRKGSGPSPPTQTMAAGPATQSAPPREPAPAGASPAAVEKEQQAAGRALQHPPGEEQQRAARGAIKATTHRVVRKGDTLAGMIMAHYGSVDRKLIERVKRKNPEIVDENLIVEGSRITLPGNE